MIRLWLAIFGLGGVSADWPSTSGDIFRSLPGSRKSLSRHTFRSTSPAAKRAAVP
jgi:hypothetical protein